MIQGPRNVDEGGRLEPKKMSSARNQTRPKRMRDFRVRDDARSVTYTAGNAVRRVAAGAPARSQNSTRPRRRLSLGAILVGAAAGLLVGGLMVVALTDAVRPSLYRRRWLGRWH